MHGGLGTCSAYHGCGWGGEGDVAGSLSSAISAGKAREGGGPGGEPRGSKTMGETNRDEEFVCALAAFNGVVMQGKVGFARALVEGQESKVERLERRSRLDSASSSGWRGRLETDEVGGTHLLCRRCPVLPFCCPDRCCGCFPVAAVLGGVLLLAACCEKNTTYDGGGVVQ